MLRKGKDPSYDLVFIHKYSYVMNKKYSTNNRSQGWKKTSEGPTQEEKALARFADIMIEKISQM